MSMNVCRLCGLQHSGEGSCPILVSLPIHGAGEPLPEGTIIGRSFRITGTLHQSEMSTVYRVVDLLDNERTIALKEFNAAAVPADRRAEALMWLAREAGLLSTLNDPRLPTFLGSASEGDRH